MMEIVDVLTGIVLMVLCTIVLSAGLLIIVHFIEKLIDRS